MKLFFNILLFLSGSCLLAQSPLKSFSDFKNEELAKEYNYRHLAMVTGKDTLAFSEFNTSGKVTRYFDQYGAHNYTYYPSGKLQFDNFRAPNSELVRSEFYENSEKLKRKSVIAQNGWKGFDNWSEDGNERCNILTRNSKEEMGWCKWNIHPEFKQLYEISWQLDDHGDTMYVHKKINRKQLENKGFVNNNHELRIYKEGKFYDHLKIENSDTLHFHEYDEKMRLVKEMKYHKKQGTTVRRTLYYDDSPDPWPDNNFNAISPIEASKIESKFSDKDGPLKDVTLETFPGNIPWKREIVKDYRFPDYMYWVKNYRHPNEIGKDTIEYISMEYFDSDSSLVGYRKWQWDKEGNLRKYISKYPGEKKLVEKYKSLKATPMIVHGTEGNLPLVPEFEEPFGDPLPCGVTDEHAPENLREIQVLEEIPQREYSREEIRQLKVKVEVTVDFLKNPGGEFEGTFMGQAGLFNNIKLKEELERIALNIQRNTHASPKELANSGQDNTNVTISMNIDKSGHLDSQKIENGSHLESIQGAALAGTFGLHHIADNSFPKLIVINHQNKKEVKTIVPEKALFRFQFTLVKK
jgi:hypothetical protein